MNKTRWTKYVEIGEWPDESDLVELVDTLFDALARTNTTLQKVLSLNPVRDADEVIESNNRILA